MGNQSQAFNRGLSDILFSWWRERLLKAGQDTLKNFIVRIMILLDKPYRVGQRIVVKGHDGVAEEIGHSQQVNLQIRQRFEEEGIKFAFPTTATYLTQNDGQSLHINVAGSPQLTEECALA